MNGINVEKQSEGKYQVFKDNEFLFSLFIETLGSSINISDDFETLFIFKSNEFRFSIFFYYSEKQNTLAIDFSYIGVVITIFSKGILLMLARLGIQMIHDWKKSKKVEQLYIDAMEKFEKKLKGKM